MSILSSILQAREVRYDRICQLNRHWPTVLSVRVNFPGTNKNHALAYLVFHAFSDSSLGIEFMEKHIFQSDDGPYILYACQLDAKQVKEKSVAFENSHPLGRLFDIDVYHHQQALERSVKRQCLICDDMAHVCVREKRHSLESVIQVIENCVLDMYSSQLLAMIDQAFMEELELEPKFGLVTKHRSGSHKDMDYDLMVKAKTVILPYFKKLFLLSVSSEIKIIDYLDEVIHIGQSAENAMFQATGGVNCYKGLIFHIGLIVVTYGYYLTREVKSSFQEVLQIFAKELVKQLPSGDTYGQYAYRKYRISGAKGEALSGYHHAICALKKESNLLKRLMYLMIRVEDTNLLKRAGSFETYLKVKEAVSCLDQTKMDEINQFSEACEKKGLSFGGSADMLVVSILLDKLEKNHDFLVLLDE